MQDGAKGTTLQLRKEELKMSRVRKLCTVPLTLALAFALLGTGVMSTAAQTKDKPVTEPVVPVSAQVIPGSPLTIGVMDNTQMSIQFSNPLVVQNQFEQFYGNYGAGVYLWARHEGTSDIKVFGPESMPGGHNANAYIPVSNTLAGSGTPDDPWVVTTVNDVPNTKLRFTMETSYVNGAEYAQFTYSLRQLGGTEAVEAVLFHAADLRTRGDVPAYGYHDEETGGTGSYYWTATGRNMYQQFIPMVPTSAHQEGSYADIWNAIGDVMAPGPGLNNICILDEALDAGIGLQWEMTVPMAGSVSVADAALFGPHEDLAGSFNDVAFDTYYYDFVYNLGSAGVINGYADGTFRPFNNATRAQLVKMVVLAQGFTINTTGGPHFTDVPVDHPFYEYIETAVNNHLVVGYDDGTFRPYANVTRAQTMKIVVLAAGWEIDTTGGPHFSDVPVGSNFYNFIETGFNHQVINGYADGTFHPYADVIRAQISKIVDLAK